MILDGEIACVDADGRSNFHKLLFRQDWPYFFAFDILAVEGENLTALPLTARKARLAGVMPLVESRVRRVGRRGGTP